MATPIYPSTFDDPLDDVETTANPKDATQVAALKETVEAKLGSRFPEETQEMGSFKPKYAARRIEEAMRRGKQLRSTAVAYGALPDFITSIDLILVKAADALAVAKQREPSPPPSTSRGPGAWTQTPVAVWPDPDDTFYRELMDV
jgi:hypothetical protein